MQRRLLFIGVAGAERAALHALADAGKLPHFARLLEAGASGELRAPPPMTPAVVWTTVATGRRPSRHGVAAPLEARPDGGGVRPIGRTAWRAPAFWELLAGAGLRTAVAGWPATAPATGWPGAVVDERFAVAAGPDFDDWPLALDCVSPTSRREELRALRVHPADIADEEIAALVPALGRVDQAADDGLRRLAALLAEAATVQAAATQFAAAGDCDLLAVRFDFLAAVHAQFGSVPADSPYAGAAAAAYQFQDMLLGRLVELAGAGTDVIAACPGRAPGERGLLAAGGPSIARDRILHGASILDLCPTTLALFGLAAAQDGRVLDDLLAAPPGRLREVRATPPAPEPPPAAGGQGGPLSPAQRRALAEAEIVRLLGLAESEMAAGAHAEAATLLERVLALQPAHGPALGLLARCRALLGEWEACGPLAERLLAREPDAPWGHLLKGAALAASGDAAAAAPHLAKAEALGRDQPLAQLYLGLLALRLGRPGAAAGHLERAAASLPDSAEPTAWLGRAYQALGRPERAEAQFREALALAYHAPQTHFRLGLALAAQGRREEAMQELRLALAQAPDLEEAAAALRRLEAATEGA